MIDIFQILYAIDIFQFLYTRNFSIFKHYRNFSIFIHVSDMTKSNNMVTSTDVKYDTTVVITVGPLERSLSFDTCCVQALLV